MWSYHEAMFAFWLDTYSAWQSAWLWWLPLSPSLEDKICSNDHPVAEAKPVEENPRFLKKTNDLFDGHDNQVEVDASHRAPVLESEVVVVRSDTVLDTDQPIAASVDENSAIAKVKNPADKADDDQDQKHSNAPRPLPEAFEVHDADYTKNDAEEDGLNYGENVLPFRRIKNSTDKMLSTAVDFEDEDTIDFDDYDIASLKATIGGSSSRRYKSLASAEGMGPSMIFGEIGEFPDEEDESDTSTLDKSEQFGDSDNENVDVITQKSEHEPISVQSHVNQDVVSTTEKETVFQEGFDGHNDSVMTEARQTDSKHPVLYADFGKVQHEIKGNEYE